MTDRLKLLDDLNKLEHQHQLEVVNRLEEVVKQTNQLNDAQHQVLQPKEDNEVEVELDVEIVGVTVYQMDDIDLPIKTNTLIKIFKNDD